MNNRAAAFLKALILPLVGLAMFWGVTATGAARLPHSEQAPARPAAPQAASIALSMTVGTDPNVCAPTSSITLPLGGGSAVLCFKVTNSGTVTLTRHTLTDTLFGPILSNFAYPLSPGASVYLTQSALITTTTSSSATWTAYNPGPTDTASDSDTVQVVVPIAAPAVVLTKTVGLDPAVCAPAESLTLPLGGGEVTYCFSVRNTGNITLTRHTLVDTRLGTILSDFSYALSPGASVYLTQTALITRPTTSFATWTAYNPGPVDTAEGTDSTAVMVPGWLYLPLLVK